MQEYALSCRDKMKKSSTYTAKNALIDIVAKAESYCMLAPDFVNSLSLVLAGIEGAFQSVNDMYCIGFAFRDSGFKNIYMDNSNQVRHFIGYLLGGFYWGNLIKTLSAYRDDDIQDRALGDAGILVGLMIPYIGRVRGTRISDWIRDNL